MGLDEEIQSTTAALVSSYERHAEGQRVGMVYLPDRAEIVKIVQLALALFFPGYFGKQELTQGELRDHTLALVTEFATLLEKQVESCLCHQAQAGQTRVDVPRCRSHGRTVTQSLLMQLPSLRDRLLTDLRAALDGDPAAGSLDEILLAYPGFLAISVHRLAHALHVLGVPLMPRIMTEWAHQKTGCDLHPGAEIGDRFFIDHATGVVVGETTTIGNGVKLYQGVTLGALSIRKDAGGNVIRGTKRHPTVQDGATLYANATVLGGDTVIGSQSIVGASAFVTKSLPPSSRVAIDPPRLRLAQHELDFEI